MWWSPLRFEAVCLFGYGNYAVAAGAAFRVAMPLLLAVAAGAAFRVALPLLQAVAAGAAFR